ncbi:MAG TPA: DUF2339 domain-containing protein [Xanthobacteraceae bacterium]|nr:DUF2339 domain-containing protein [Xanthobacteraceae bacterium]
MLDIAGLLVLLALFLLHRLRRRVARLEARLAAFEAGAAQAGIVLQLPEAPPPGPAPLVGAQSPFAPKPPEVEPNSSAAEPPPADALPEPAMAMSAAEPPPAPPARTLAGFEERFGALWTVWLGGLALALGGIFLVRYAIEADLIGPGTRVTLGVLLALALLAGGEWLRRADKKIGAGLPVADVPAMLTAAGTSTAYAVVYAAYELYGLLPPPLAFLLLGAVAVASMLAALLHGPILAALGLVGAGVAPLLVSTEEPSAWGLALYIVVVLAAALGVARIRLWAWLAGLAIAGGFSWALLLIGLPEEAASAGPAGAIAAALAALTAALLVPGLLRGPPDEGATLPDPVPSLGFGAALLLAAALTVKTDQGLGTLLLFDAVTLAALAAAWRAPAAGAAPLLAVPTAALVLVAWDVLAQGGSTVAAPGAMAGLLDGPPVIDVAGFSAFGLTLGAAFAFTGYLAAGRAQRLVPALLWSATAVGGPLLLLLAAYWRLAGFGVSTAFAALALLLAALATAAVDRLSRRPGAGGHAAAAFAAGAAGALALGLTMALEKGWLTVGLALASLGIAWVWSRRPLPGLRQVSALVGLAVFGRVVWDPSIAGGDPGEGLIFNWLLWGYGVPALAFALAAWRLGGADWSRRVHEGLAFLFAVLLAVWQIRHAIYGADLLAPAFGLAETGALLCVALAYATALERLRRASDSPVYALGSLAALGAALLLAAWALTIDSPLLFGPRVEGRFVNLLLLAYGLPALLAAGLAATAHGRRGRWHGRLCGGLALLLGLAYLTLQVRRLFQGPDMSGPDPMGVELYAYSAVWLVFGIALLVAGLLSGSRALRLASALIVMLTILKVFLWDMADLEGVLRALSFIGLGLVLMGIGRLYQRLLRRPAAEPAGPA